MIKFISNSLMSLNWYLKGIRGYLKSTSWETKTLGSCSKPLSKESYELFILILINIILFIIIIYFIIILILLFIIFHNIIY